MEGGSKRAEIDDGRGLGKKETEDKQEEARNQGGIIINNQDSQDNQ